MNQDLINRYQPGGDIYASLQTTYGTTAANQIATAALSGDRTVITDAIAQVKYGNPLETSTASIFTQQILTDPLGAPLADLNTLVSNSWGSFFKSKAVVSTLIVAAAICLFVKFDGVMILKKQLEKIK